MRTRSQPISPSGFQSLETASRKKKAPAAAPSKTDKPKKEATRVSKGRAKKAPPRKTAAQKKALEKEAEAVVPVVEPAQPHASPVVSNPVPGSSAPAAPPPPPSEPPVEKTVQSELEISSSSMNPLNRLPRKILKPRLLQRFSGLLRSPESLSSSPTQDILDRARRAQNSAAAELIFGQPSPGRLDSSGEECAPKCPCCSQVLTCPSGHSVWTDAGFRVMRRAKSLTTPTEESRKRGRESGTENDNDHQEERPSKRSQPDKQASKPARNPVVELHRRRRVTPSSERQRRRLVESQGRIDKTVFRIPELIAQNKADEEEEAARQAKADEENNSDVDAEVEPVVPYVRAADTPSRPRASRGRRQTPGLPTTPRRGWNFGNLLSSVPRSISKLLPFGEREEEDEANSSMIATPTPTPLATPTPVSAPARAAPPSPSPQPGEQTASQQQVSTPTAPSPDLSYSLFPKPLSWSPLNRNKSPSKENQIKIAEDPVSNGTDKPEETTPSNKLKRKRGTPFKIPNPPGVSYGMHPDYFGSSTESDTDDEIQNNGSPKAQQSRLGSLKQITTGKSAEPKAKESNEDFAAPQTPFRGILRMRKRVRFGPSPQDVPSKSRLRMFDNLPQDTPVRPAKANVRASELQHSETMPGSYIESPQDTTPSPSQGRSPLAEKENEKEMPSNFNRGGSFSAEEDVLYADDFFDHIPEDQIKGLTDENREEYLAEIREGKERRRREREAALQKQQKPKLSQVASPEQSLSLVAQGKQPAEHTKQSHQLDGAPSTHQNEEGAPPKTPTHTTPSGLGSIVARRAISRSRGANDAPGVAPPTRSLASQPPPPFYPSQVGRGAVERLRSELDEFRPKCPSALQIAERLASSPLAAPAPLARELGAGAPISSPFGWPSATPIARLGAGQPSFERLREEFRQVLRSR